MSELEVLLRKKLASAEEKKVGKEFTQEMKEELILDAQLPLASYNLERRKALTKWTLEEEMLRGQLMTCTADRYHAKMKEAKSCRAIWTLLKKESNQEEPGQLMIRISLDSNIYQMRSCWMPLLESN